MTSASDHTAAKVLLVSDLDGTLLDSRKRLTERSRETINRFVGAGGLFSVATARMVYSCQERLAGVELRLPIIAMNGAAVCNLSTGDYVHYFPIAPSSVLGLASVIADAGADAFIYAVAGGRLTIGYTSEAALVWTQYNSAPAQQSHAPFTLVTPADWNDLGEVIYVAVVGSDEVLAQVQRLAVGVGELQLLPYRNIYTETDCLEIASPAAGKHNALRILAELAGADRLVVFGDNHNDLEMMRLADVALAPSNSTPEALAEADIIMGTNDEDAVAVEIETNYLPVLPS